MMGSKARIFGPRTSVTLDDLVLQDHFYRHLERSLDLGFVRDLVRERYAALGRPSIDPIVFFKLHFEGIRSARQLELVGADRFGIEVFRQFFELILGRCPEAGLLVGRALYADGTLVEANADRDKIVPRFAVEAYLKQLFGDDYAAPDQTVSLEPSAAASPPAAALARLERLRCRVRARQRRAPRHDPLVRGRFPCTLPPCSDRSCSGTAAPSPPAPPPASELPAAQTVAPTSQTPAPSPVPLPIELRSDLEPAQRAELAARNLHRHDWFALHGAPDRSIRRCGYQRVSDFWVSTTDPDATLMRQHGQGVKLRYRTHYIVDGGPARLILEALVRPSDVSENTIFLDLLWRACFRWKLRPQSVSGDTTYGTLDIIKAVEDAGIRAYMPLADHIPATPQVGKQAFSYDPLADQYVCPQCAILRRISTLQEQRISLYQAEASRCGSCPLKVQCSKGQDGRIIRRSLMRLMWSAYAATTRAATTNRPMRSARCGSSRCLARRKSGTA